VVIVVVIIAILAAMAIPKFIAISNKKQEADFANSPLIYPEKHMTGEAPIKPDPPHICVGGTKYWRYHDFVDGTHFLPAFAPNQTSVLRCD
jgi:hypothetical protein